MQKVGGFPRGDPYLPGNQNYNIASRAAQSNSVYVSVLKLTNREACALLCYKARRKRLEHERSVGRNEDNFPTFSLELEF